ncbi:MAG: response regulator [Nitrospinae bacterium]|nr:response regulator [Nitrospinota bacterium]
MKTILIVDDHERIRELVAATLGDIGDYQILEAKNAEEGVTLARESHPNLVLMDVTMPGAYDGLEAARIIKSDPDTSDIYVVMLTAKGQMSDVERGDEAGVDGYFVKPFSPIELINKVESLLG